MLFNRKSAIREFWRHPVGHDVLQAMLRQKGRDENLPENPLIGNLPVSVLDRIAGKGFADLLLAVAATYYETPPITHTERRKWWEGSCIYQVYLPSFMDADHDGMGDLAGVLQRLPYLVKLGVDVLWLRPFLKADSGGVLDYHMVAPEYGTNDDFCRLAQIAHQQGLKVIIEMDVNATSVRHPWFSPTAQGGKLPYYVLKTGSPSVPPTDWCDFSGRPAWKWHPGFGLWALHLFGSDTVELDWSNADLRAEMEDIVTFWLGLGADGFCFGKVNLIDKGDFGNADAYLPLLTGICGFENYGFGPRMHRYLRDLRAVGHGVDWFAMGDVVNVGTEMAKLLTGEAREELDMVLVTSHSALRPKKSRDSVPLELLDLKRYYLRWMEQFANDNWMPIILDSPNTPRIIGRFGANPLYRGILAKLIALIMFTMRGSPVLYQGQELGLPNIRMSSAAQLQDSAALRVYEEMVGLLGESAALARAAAVAGDHARVPMPWNATRGVGFSGAKPWQDPLEGSEHLNVATQAEDAGSVLQFHKKLIALRKAHPCLVYGRFTSVFANSREVFCYFRMYGNEKWYVEINLLERETPRPGKILPSQRLILSNYGTPSAILRPYEANLYFCESN